MKASTRLAEYYQRESRHLYRLFNKHVESFDEKDFHMLRVHIKKIKAILALMEYSIRDFPIDKYFKPYKVIFRHAGKIRELQLQLSLMKKFKSRDTLHTYFSQLEKTLQQHHKDFLHLIDKKLKRKIKKKNKRIVSFLKTIKPHVIKNFLFDRKVELQNLLNTEKLNAEQVHDLRKHIKDLNYLLNIFKPKDKGPCVPDAFQELIGQWHDYDVISNDLLKDAQHHDLKPEEVKAIMDLQQKISNKAEELIARVELAKANI